MFPKGSYSRKSDFSVVCRERGILKERSWGLRKSSEKSGVVLLGFPGTAPAQGFGPDMRLPLRNEGAIRLCDPVLVGI